MLGHLNLMFSPNPEEHPLMQLGIVQERLHTNNKNDTK